MNLMVMLGMSVCIFCLFYGIPGLWSNIGIYIDPNSFVLVLGGTVGATIISTSPKDFLSILKIISGYMQRHTLKPGMTGLAQIEGFRGETRTKKDMEKRKRI